MLQSNKPALNTQLIAIRSLEVDDANFIFSTILRGLYYGDSWFRAIPKDIFMVNYHHVVEVLLKTMSVTIACLSDDPTVILGYSIHKGTVLHYVFVKKPWRNIGIAKMLVPKNITFVTHLTSAGKNLLNKLPGAVFNPFAINQ